MQKLLSHDAVHKDVDALQAWRDLHACIFVCVYMCVYTCADVCMYVYVYVHTYIYTDIQIYMCTCVCMSTRFRHCGTRRCLRPVHISICVFVCMRTYIIMYRWIDLLCVHCRYCRTRSSAFATRSSSTSRSTSNDPCTGSSYRYICGCIIALSADPPLLCIICLQVPYL